MGVFQTSALRHQPSSLCFSEFDTSFSASETSVLLAENIFAQQKQTQDAFTMQTSFIIAVALAVAVAMVILCLVAVIVFQRWRINDNNAHLEKFINENLELRQRLHQAGIV